MAKLITGIYRAKPKKKRPGVHSKKRTSSHKHSKNYKKKYRGQGK
jgi:hypothetical protein